MKKFILSAAILATLASCNYNNTIATNYEAIQFGNAFVENNVRAAVDPSYGTHNPLKSITVYGAVEGVNIFPGVTVEGTPNGSAWVQKTGITQYWIAGANYTFDAVVGATAVTTDTNTGLPTSLKYDTANQTDMLHKRVTTVGKPDDNNGLVAFTFTHLLSKVNFTVNNGSTEADGYSFVVKNIKFEGNTTGVYDVANSEWLADKFTTGETAVGNGDPKEIVVASGVLSNELTTEVLFLPGTYTISFTVDILYNGAVVTSTDYPTTPGSYSYNLVAANAYDFNVNVKVGELIQFTVTANPEWTPGTDPDEIEL